jgi:hypothetical protein
MSFRGGGPMLILTAALTASVAAPPPQPPQADMPAQQLQPSTAPDVTPPERVATQLTRRLASLEQTVRRQASIIRTQGSIVRKLRHSLRASLDTTGGLAQAFLCIHSFEAAWTDAGSPYWGGLQFDGGFMATYGGAFLRAWGTAEHWPAFVQVAVAENAYLSGRGFFAWPTSARLCGLL